MYRVPYCSKALYENLYASYLNSSPHVLLDAAGIADWQGKEVLDLCGGNGRLSMAACQMGAKVRMIEGDREMCDPGELAKWGIDARFGKVELMLRVYARLDCPLLFDAVFCQQAINYWLTLETARDTAANMRVGGVFVFNTFQHDTSHGSDLQGTGCRGPPRVRGFPLLPRHRPPRTGVAIAGCWLPGG